MSASQEQGQGPVIRDRRRIDPVTGQPRDAGSGQAPRAGHPRPGKHAVSKPGSPRGEAARGEQPGAAGPVPGEAAGPRAERPSGEPRPAAPGPEAPPEAQAQPQEPQAGPAQPPRNGDGQPGGSPDLAVALAERTADLQRVQAEYANYRKRVERDRAAVREHALATVIAELLPVLDDIGRAREHGELTGGFKSVAESLEAAVAKLGLTAFGEAGEAFDPKVHEALMHSYSAEVTEPTCVQILLPGYRVGDRILRPARVAVAEPTDPSGARPPADAGRGAATGPGAATGAGPSGGDAPGSAASAGDAPDAGSAAGDARAQPGAG